MQRVLITGKNGTVGSALAKYLLEIGMEVFGWDRNKFPPNEPSATKEIFSEIKPHILFHLAVPTKPTNLENESKIINFDWSERLAEITSELKVKMVFTSTIMVFTEKNPGPYTIDSIPDAQESYGYEKKLVEELIFQKNPNATIARLGWQIGEKTGSNNMLDFLEKEMQNNKVIRASKKWFPSCSLLKDTAKTLHQISGKGSGTYLVNSNTKWNFYEICNALKKHHKKDWEIKTTEDFVYDQRMFDERIKIPPLSQTLDLH